jgi:hypothetical protein
LVFRPTQRVDLDDQLPDVARRILHAVPILVATTQVQVGFHLVEVVTGLLQLFGERHGSILRFILASAATWIWLTLGSLTPSAAAVCLAPVLFDLHMQRQIHFGSENGFQLLACLGTGNLE